MGLTSRRWFGLAWGFAAVAAASAACAELKLAPAEEQPLSAVAPGQLDAGSRPVDRGDDGGDIGRVLDADVEGLMDAGDGGDALSSPHAPADGGADERDAGDPNAPGRDSGS